MKNRRKDSGIAIDVALIVLLLAVFSSLFASGFLAKYRTGGDNTDTARVAKWKVSAASGPLIEILPGGSVNVTYPIEVVNRSETAVEYGITITFNESIADKVSNPRINGQAPSEGSAFTTTLTFARVGSIAAATESSPASVTVNLTFTFPESYLSSITGEDYDNNVISNAAFDIPFSVHIDVVQMD